jgi:hypothetical protein
MQEMSFRYHQVEICVIDGETMQPIGGALVRTEYDGGWGAEPDADQGVTDHNGCVRLRVESKSSAFLFVNAPEFMDLPFTYLDPTKPRSVVTVYRPPDFISGVEIPSGYRGVLQIHDGSGSDKPPVPPVPWPKGQRAFLTRVNTTGITEIQPAPVLTVSLPWGTLRCARFDDGTPLPVVLGEMEGDLLSGKFIPESWYGPHRANLIGVDARLLSNTALRTADSLALWEIGLTDPANWQHCTYIYYVGTYAQAKSAQAQIPRTHQLRLPAWNRVASDAAK